MQRSNRATGLISMCIGGGMGMAMVVSNNNHNNPRKG
jgi:acetyl-CoA acetyltransferase